MALSHSALYENTLHSQEELQYETQRVDVKMSQSNEKNLAFTLDTNSTFVEEIIGDKQFISLPQADNGHENEENTEKNAAQSDIHLIDTVKSNSNPELQTNLDFSNEVMAHKSYSSSVDNQQTEYNKELYKENKESDFSKVDHVESDSSQPHGTTSSTHADLSHKLSDIAKNREVAIKASAPGFLDSKEERQVLQKKTEGVEIYDLQPEASAAKIPSIQISPIAYDRLHLLEALRRAFIMREEMQKLNEDIQYKLAKFFKQRKGDTIVKPESDIRDHELRYLKDLEQMEDLKTTHTYKVEMYNDMIKHLKEKCEDKRRLLKEKEAQFIKHKYDVARTALSRRTNAPIPVKELEKYMENAEKKNKEVYKIRLEYIRRKNKLQQKEEQLKIKENVGEGLSLIDFEQLKIENQTYNEKIEERNEEILKLRRKITNTVQIMTHLKEKLQWLYRGNLEDGEKLAETGDLLVKKRDFLGKTKKARDVLRHDNNKLKIKSGLGGHLMLLRDFEHQRDIVENIVRRIDFQRARHNQLSMAIVHIRKKIHATREFD